MPENPYEDGLDKTAANFVPLSPLSFIARTKDVYPDHPAVIYGSRRRLRNERRSNANEAKSGRRTCS